MESSKLGVWLKLTWRKLKYGVCPPPIIEPPLLNVLLEELADQCNFVFLL